MLKEIMGHSDVTTTANIYTHVGIDVLKDEMQSAGNKNYVVCAYDREAENPALDDDMEYDDWKQIVVRKNFIPEFVPEKHPQKIGS